MSRAARRLRSRLLPGLLALLAASAASAAWADGAHHSLWVVKGHGNQLVLLGSVHVLKPDDSQLPAEALQAYAHATALVMELDLNALKPEDMMLSMATLGALPQDETLQQALGPTLYARFAAQARADGLDAALLEHLQPWMAALMLDQAQMARLGYETAAGVDQQFAQRAAADHKRIIGLETMDEQLGLFAQLSREQQQRYLRYTLDEHARAAGELKAMVAAWQAGDTRTLERLLTEGFEDFPDLFRTLTTERNRRWLQVLEPLLNGQQDYLVVVGALHLVGKDGLVALLRERGYSVEQH
jgi:uncharacterized protein YbaP (TraB family)